jgi:D-3-phosphoglycerate dehydrogenase
MESGQLSAQPRLQAHQVPITIVVADDLPESALQLLRAEGWEVDARSGRSPADLRLALANADALMVRSATKVTADLMTAAPRLRVVARAGTGVDNVDVAAASARGILVVNAPGANSISVAEHACALMLALARSVAAADRAMKDGRWEKKKFLGTELRGKTLGIVGLGRIGQEVALRAKAFGMKIVAHDPFLSREIAASAGVELLPLDEVCAGADFLSLHLPSTAETHHLFNDSRFARVKRGVRIVNTARGELIDESALKRAIESGAVAGAALDVFEKEPPPDWVLAQLPQVVATPHIAASTEEAQ